MILTLKELAIYLRVNERTILRMQQSGQIKGVKIGGQWRFNGSQIDALFFPDKALTGPDTVPLADLTRSPIVVPLSRVLRPDRFIMEMKAKDATGVLDELCSLISAKNLCLDTNDLRQRIDSREQLLSTGVGRGVAIPHPRDPVPALPEPTIIVIGFSRKGVDYKAVDGKRVHLFILLCDQSIQMHLHMMGRLAKLLSPPETAAELIAATSPEEFQRIVMEVERREFLTEGA